MSTVMGWHGLYPARRVDAGVTLMHVVALVLGAVGAEERAACEVMLPP